MEAEWEDRLIKIKEKYPNMASHENSIIFQREIFRLDKKRNDMVYRSNNERRKRVG